MLPDRLVLQHHHHRGRAVGFFPLFDDCVCIIAFLLQEEGMMLDNQMSDKTVRLHRNSSNNCLWQEASQVLRVSGTGDGDDCISMNIERVHRRDGILGVFFIFYLFYFIYPPALRWHSVAENIGLRF